MVRWIIRAAVSGIVVAILLSIIPFDAVRTALGRISFWAWSASVVIFFCGHYLNAVKLRLLLGPSAAPLSNCVRAQYAGLVANLSLPGLAGGDLVRAAYLAPTAGVKRVTLASIADRLIDTTTVLALVAVALPFAGVPTAIAGILKSAALWVVGGGVAAAIAVAIVMRLRKRGGSPGTLLEVGRELLSRRGALAGAVIISLGVQSAFVMTNVWLASQVGVATGLSAWFVAWPLSKLVAVLPISLGGIGVREAALVSLLAPYGAPREAVLASGILWQGVLIVTGVVGLVVTQLLPKSTVAAAAKTSPGKA